VDDAPAVDQGDAIGKVFQNLPFRKGSRRAACLIFGKLRHQAASSADDSISKV
jgi:hypothetical protein